MVSVVFDASELDGLIQRAVEAAIQRMEEKRPKDDEGAILWDRPTAADKLGVSTTTLDRLRKTAGLPAVKLDGKVLFSPTSLASWAAQHEQIGG